MLEPIESARLRLAWARKHITDFDSEAGVYHALRPYKLVPHFNHETRECFYRVELKDPVPHRLSLLIGDAVHTLRIVLDGLFWALAQRHGMEDDVTFPIRKTPDSYREACKPVQGRVPQVTLDRLEDFQAYNRGQILRDIHDLDLINKHRALLVALHTPSKARFDADVDFSGMLCTGPVEDGAAIARLHFPGDDEETNIKAHVTLEISFGDFGHFYGERVWHLLTTAHRFIEGEVIPVFDSELQR